MCPGSLDGSPGTVFSLIPAPVAETEGTPRLSRELSQKTGKASDFIVSGTVFYLVGDEEVCLRLEFLSL